MVKLLFTHFGSKQICRGDKCRSMVHVGNVVDAALTVAGNRNCPSELYIVTDDMDYTVRELYETIAEGLGRKAIPFGVPLGAARFLAVLGDIGGRATGRPIQFNTDTLRKLTTPLIFSSERLRRDTGFIPKYNLNNTIKEIIHWYRIESK